ncbi:ABC transporter substrate-binding protein [Phaeacidiphilus oryzae]|uniref:ABC transporter substrate-binding protein n=1 Tax=Phaeacidiphilus oryzae TaxID=348818 RepID=UPI0009FD963D|nr:ABC transporter substrate-binding protein [Phaeacidiphilus oryzae]
MSRRSTVTGMAIVAALALGAAACSSSSPSSNSSSGASGGSAKPLVIEDNPISSFTNDFNPFDTKSSSSDENTNALVYEPLLQYNTLNSAQPPIPWLATKWAWSNGNKTLTLSLKQGVKWSDGQAFSSADVKFTMQLLAKNPGANRWGVPNVSSVSTPDANTVVLNYSTPQSAALANIGNTLIVPQHIWSSVTNPATAVIATSKAIGTGPFLVDKFTPQNITYKANNGYWGGAPKVKAVSLPAYANNDAATLALSSGQIDLAGNNINNVENTFVAKNPSTNHLFMEKPPYFPGTNTVVLLLNNKSTSAPALADAGVRKAISAGVDRQALATQCETNYELPASSSGGLTLPMDKAFLDSKVSDDLKPTTDSAKVTSLMQGAGYTKTGGKWTKGGQTVKFTIIDPNSFSDYWCGAQQIAKQLNAEGFDVTANGAYDPNTWSDAVTNGKYDASIHWGQGGTPFQRLQFIADSAQSAPVGQPAAGDLERYQSAAADAAVKTYESATTTDQAQAALNKLQEQIAADAPSTPILYGAGWYEYSTANFTGWANESNPYVNPAPNDQNYEYLVLHLKPNS